ncbi:MAG: glycosyltransferase [Paracoccaceae bacterium]
MIDFEAKLIRGEACFHAAEKLRSEGFQPDVILTHPGWGESLFLKDVWPEARIGLYCELFYQTKELDSDFDPEFVPKNPTVGPLKTRIRNLNNHMHFNIAEAGLSPTRFQADTFPPSFRDEITISHDGVDTDHVIANAEAVLQVSESQSLSRKDEVITFVNRNLEPYRGYHVFMRALPELLRKRPKAQIVLLGDDGTSYGARPPKGKTWKQIFIDEVRSDISDADWQRVHFLGRVPYETFLSVLQVSQVHVYLTYPFVLSWSLIEAMSAECAIVTSNTAPVKEVIKNGKTGVLVDFFDGKALVRRIDSLLEDDTRRRKLGAAARAHVTKNYDLQSRCLPAQLKWVDKLEKLPLKPIKA